MKNSQILLELLIIKNDKFSLNYNFALDQNYEDLNYNEIGS